MSCACENRRKSQELDRIRNLAKIFAKMENETVVLYKSPDGILGFSSMQSNEPKNEIVEYITPY